MKPDGKIGFQAVYQCFQEKLLPFDKNDNDEMDEIILWDLVRDIG